MVMHSHSPLPEMQMHTYVQREFACNPGTGVIGMNCSSDATTSSINFLMSYLACQMSEKVSMPKCWTWAAVGRWAAGTGDGMCLDSAQCSCCMSFLSFLC